MSLVMGANARRRHLERIMRRSSMAPKPPVSPITEVKPPIRFRMKRSFKLIAVFGWAVAILLWGLVR